MPDDKDESKPSAPSSKEGTSAASPRAAAAGAKAPSSKTAAKSTSSTRRSRAEEEDDDEDDDLDDEDDDLDEDDDDLDDEDDEDEDDDEPPPPPKKAVKGKVPAGKAKAPPARKPVPARAVKPAAKKRAGGRPAVRVPHPPVSHFIPFAIAGMGLVGAHVFWDVQYAPVAVLGISIVIWAFMGIGSANEVQSLGRPPPTEVGGSLHEVTETKKPGISAGLVSFRTRRRPCRTESEPAGRQACPC